MQRVLCDCSVRVTVVLGVTQPQRLSHKFATACCAILNLAKLAFSYIFNLSKESEDEMAA